VKVLQHLGGAAPPPLCGGAANVTFPPRNETVDFRRLLDEQPAVPEGPWTTSVDREGEAVWLQEYLRFRVSGCSHDAAARTVLNQIIGAAEQPACVVR
jgi:hypothetical protein